MYCGLALAELCEVKTAKRKNNKNRKKIKSVKNPTIRLRPSDFLFICK